MRKKILWVVPLLMLLGSALYAQDVAGDWQGTLVVGKGLDRAANREGRQRGLE
jgi:hypothetical protein